LLCFAVSWAPDLKNDQNAHTPLSFLSGFFFLRAAHGSNRQISIGNRAYLNLVLHDGVFDCLLVGEALRQRRLVSPFTLGEEKPRVAIA
jgi:hypothetical protein